MHAAALALLSALLCAAVSAAADDAGAADGSCATHTPAPRRGFRRPPLVRFRTYNLTRPQPVRRPRRPHPPPPAAAADLSLRSRSPRRRAADG